MSIMDDWAALVVGKPLDPDGHYGNQCVDTIDHFGEFIYDVSWRICVGGVGGANELLDVAPDKYWQRIDYYHGFIPQRFDVLVFGGDYLNRFGHTCVNWNANSIYMDVIQQDGFAKPWKFVDGNWYSDKPAHVYRLNYRQDGTGPLLGVLRPRPELLRAGGSLTPAGSTTSPSQEEDDMYTDADRARDLQTADRVNYLWDHYGPGKDGYKPEGDMSDTIRDAARDAAATLDSVTPGESNKRPAGATVQAMVAIAAGAEDKSVEDIASRTAEKLAGGVEFVLQPKQEG